MSKDTSKLDSMIHGVIREQRVIGTNPAADTLKPFTNLITTSLPQTDDIIDDDE
ncbi:hypothetical protein [Treponema primitia]|uniref:hypothetical protein n=1 Tax=Treponema primitia TaxID=88058 RepID=UPI0002554E52|nr:hypothetical protein [Treponema primitia]